MKNLQEKVAALLREAGIIINGKNVWDIQIPCDSVYERILRGGSLALGETYMEGLWRVERLDLFFEKILIADLDDKVKPWHFAFDYAYSVLFNRQTKTTSQEVAREHYDLGIDLYGSFLDPYNQYTCGYFKDTESLYIAQEQKLDLICKKLGLAPGMSVLDIGCGWGGFAKFAAERYDCRVVGISISREQIKYAKSYTANLPVKIINMDYRELDTLFDGRNSHQQLSEKFDRVLVCGMLEHVGPKNYRELFSIISQSMKDDGLFLLHTIGGNKSTTRTDPWIDKYIFPNGVIPSVSQLGKAFEGLFVIEDWHNFGHYYYQTLMAWHENFCRHWDSLQSKNEMYDDRFFRMWEYYLLSCAGSFKARKNQLWQVVLSKNGVPGGYLSVR